MHKGDRHIGHGTEHGGTRILLHLCLCRYVLGQQTALPNSNHCVSECYDRPPSRATVPHIASRGHPHALSHASGTIRPGLGNWSSIFCCRCEKNPSCKPNSMIRRVRSACCWHGVPTCCPSHAQRWSDKCTTEDGRCGLRCFFGSTARASTTRNNGDMVACAAIVYMYGHWLNYSHVMHAPGRGRKSNDFYRQEIYSLSVFFVSISTVHTDAYYMVRGQLCSGTWDTCVDTTLARTCASTSKRNAVWWQHDLRKYLTVSHSSTTWHAYLAWTHTGTYVNIQTTGTNCRTQYFGAHTIGTYPAASTPHCWQGILRTNSGDTSGPTNSRDLPTVGAMSGATATQGVYGTTNGYVLFPRSLRNHALSFPTRRNTRAPATRAPGLLLGSSGQASTPEGCPTMVLLHMAVGTDICGRFGPLCRTGPPEPEEYCSAAHQIGTTMDPIEMESAPTNHGATPTACLSHNQGKMPRPYHGTAYVRANPRTRARDHLQRPGRPKTIFTQGRSRSPPGQKTGRGQHVDTVAQQRPPGHHQAENQQITSPAAVSTTVHMWPD